MKFVQISKFHMFRYLINYHLSFMMKLHKTWLNPELTMLMIIYGWKCARLFLSRSGLACTIMSWLRNAPSEVNPWRSKSSWHSTFNFLNVPSDCSRFLSFFPICCTALLPNGHQARYWQKCHFLCFQWGVSRILAFRIF